MPNYGLPNPFPFDPSHGYDRESLFKVGCPDNEPEDFDAFWQNLYEKTLSVPLRLERRPSRCIAKHHHVEEVFFDTLEGFRIGSYLMTPKNGLVSKVLVQGHGYGGREAPDLDISPDTASINPLAPGFQLSQHPNLPLNDAEKHVVHGAEDKDSYIFRICAAAWWSSASVMLELFPERSETLTYSGWSYGGGMGCLMLPWDQRFRGAELGQVSFCHIPIRLTCPCTGSGKATTSLFRSKPSVLQTSLRYFDAAFAAKRIKVPTVFAASLFDPAVPPPGQFCAHNLCPAPKRCSVFTTGHYDVAHDRLEAEWDAHRRNLIELGLKK